MSAYVSISKSIGWDKKDVSIPSEDSIKKLIKEAKKGSESAFAKLFEIYRFGSPNSDVELKDLNLICDNFSALRTIFEEMD